MGTKIDCKSYLPGFCLSMRDLNGDSSSSSWPVGYEDKTLTNGQYYDGFIPRTLIDGLKQKMLQHEAIFRHQVYELHRPYRIQRDMMEEVKRKEINGPRASIEQPSSSSSLRGSQMPSQDARKWHISGVEIGNSPLSCTMGYNTTLPYHFPLRNESSLKELDLSDSRPLKLRKKLFDFQLPVDEYVDEEGEKLSGIKSHSASIRLADLNDPVRIEEGMALSTVDFLDHGSFVGERKSFGIITNTTLRFDVFTKEKKSSEITKKPTMNGSALNPGFVNEISAKNGFYHESVSKSNGTSRFDYLKCSRPDNVTAGRSSNHTFGYFSKSPSCLPNSKPVIKLQDLNQPFTPKVTSNREIATKEGFFFETQNVEKILGFPIFKTGPSENVPSSSASNSCPKNVGKKNKNGIIDLNLEYEPDDETSPGILNVENEKNETMVAFVRDYIDLNSCISDFEDDVLASSSESKATSIKIDLEAPVEIEENMTGEASSELIQNKIESSQYEILKNAAKIMVAITSSSCPGNGTSHPSDDDASLSESLIWLADQLVTNVSALRDRPSGPGDPPCEEMDEFEAMTLQIQETKEEDYVPTPFVHEFQNFYETGPTRSRRGRQRRDFQRDILPGLVSLL